MGNWRVLKKNWTIGTIRVLKKLGNWAIGTIRVLKKLGNWAIGTIRVLKKIGEKILPWRRAGQTCQKAPIYGSLYEALFICHF